MEYKLMNPNPVRLSSRETRMRKTMYAMPQTLWKGHLLTIKKQATKLIKQSEDRDNKGYPALMINQILWNAYVENLMIVNKLLEEI